jgi:dihydropteroate synthase
VLSLPELARLVRQYPEALDAVVREFSLGGRRLKFNSRPAIMGVINLSPDSWYRESVCLNLEMALRRLHTLKAQGADLVDVGAESTLPQAARVNAREQSSLLLPLLAEARRSRIPVSVETYSAAVVKRSLEAGAAVINLTGGAVNRRVFHLVAEHGAAVILCHVQGRHVRAVDALTFARDPISVMYEYFARRIEVAEQCGVRKILLDPGLGFYYRNLMDSARRIRFQLRTFLHTFRLKPLGWPVCHALPHAFELFADEVRCAEPFFAVLAALGGTHLFRTHEVPRVRAVLAGLSQVGEPNFVGAG